MAYHRTCLALLFFALISVSYAQLSNKAVNGLSDFYDSCNGRNWHHKGSWKNGDPCNNNWHGVVCNNNGNKIKEIHLESNNLKCKLHDEFGQLFSALDNSLVYLNMSDNRLTGFIPAAIDFLTGLQFLDLSWNDLTGAVPYFIELQDLVEIELHHNDFRAPFPASLLNIPLIKTIQIQDNHFFGYLPENIGDFRALVLLDISHNDFIGTIPESWSSMDDLTLFAARNNSLEGRVPKWPVNLDAVDLSLNNDFHCPLPDYQFIAAPIGLECHRCDKGYGLVHVRSSQRGRSDNCTICKPGYASDGRGSCKKCKSNHFSPDAGASFCTKCADDTTSKPGSAVCVASTSFYTTSSGSGGFDYSPLIIGFGVATLCVLFGIGLMIMMTNRRLSAIVYNPRGQVPLS